VTEPASGRHHIARNRDRQVGIVRRAVAQLAAVVVAPSPQRRIGDTQVRRQTEGHSRHIRNHHRIAAAVSELERTEAQRAVRLAGKKNPVLDPLVERFGAAVADAQAGLLSDRHRRAHRLGRNGGRSDHRHADEACHAGVAVRVGRRKDDALCGGALRRNGLWRGKRESAVHRTRSAAQRGGGQCLADHEV